VTGIQGKAVSAGIAQLVTQLNGGLIRNTGASVGVGEQTVSTASVQSQFYLPVQPQNSTVNTLLNYGSVSASVYPGQGDTLNYLGTTYNPLTAASSTCYEFEYITSDKTWYALATAGLGGGGTGGVSGVTATDTSVVVTGMATNPTLATNSIDVIATNHPTAADWSNNSHKQTSLKSGTVASDSANVGQLTPTFPNPALHGLLAWNGDPATDFTSSILIVKGVGYVMKVPWPVAQTSASVGTAVSTGQALSNCFMGVYNSSGASVSVTGDISSALTGAGTAFGAYTGGSLSIPSGSLTDFVFVYFLASNSNAGTLTLRLSATGAPGIVLTNANLARSASRMSLLGSSLTALPTSITPSSLTQTASMPFACLA
jgi:hypothetical protein